MRSFNALCQLRLVGASGDPPFSFRCHRTPVFDGAATVICTDGGTVSD